MKDDYRASIYLSIAKAYFKRSAKMPAFEQPMWIALFLWAEAS